MDQQSDAARALADCALLHTFDLADLSAILRIDEAAARTLLAGAAVEPLADPPGCFRLRAGRRAALLADLRRARPRDEPALHRRAFDHFLRRLADAPDARQIDRLQDACVHHLRALRDLNLDYMRWDEILPLVAALRAAIPRLRPEHAGFLKLIEAYHATRRQEYERSEAMLREIMDLADLTPALRAEALKTRGLCRLGQSQLEGARADFEHARDLGAALGDHGIQGDALINLSWIHNDLSQFEPALRLSEESLSHFQAAGDHYGSAFAIYSIGNNALSLGRWELGRQQLDQAAALYEAAGMDARLASVDWVRGLLHQLLGEEALSEQAYLRALAGAQSPEHGNLVTEIDSQIHLGLLYQTLGRLDSAAERYLGAIDLASRLHDDLRCALVLHRYGQVRWRQGDREAALAAYADAEARIDAMRASTKGEEMKLGLLGTTQQVYETIVLALIERGDLEAAFAYSERARHRAFLDLVARRGAIDALPTYPTIGLRALQERLAPDAALLEYYTIGVVAPQGSLPLRAPETNARLRTLLVNDPQIVLFAVAADRAELHRIAVDPNQLQPPPGDPTPGWHLFSDRRLAWLSSRLIAPAAGLLAGRRIIQVVPHGPLHYAPFAALRAPGGESPAIAYAPSATVLCACAERPAAGAQAALALGYNDSGPTALRYAEREAALVAELIGASVQLGPEPKLATLFERAPLLRRLHIAGHAFFRADDPMGSFLRLGASDDIDARTLMERLKLNGALVTLNACTSGLSRVASGDELLGLPRAFLYAGAATIVCTLHEVDDLAASIMMLSFYQNIARAQSPAVALHNAQQALRMMTRSELTTLLTSVFSDEAATDVGLTMDGENPFAPARYWAPFMVIGTP